VPICSIEDTVSVLLLCCRWKNIHSKTCIQHLLRYFANFLGVDHCQTNHSVPTNQSLQVMSWKVFYFFGIMYACTWLIYIAYFCFRTCPFFLFFNPNFSSHFTKFLLRNCSVADVSNADLVWGGFLQTRLGFRVRNFTHTVFFFWYIGTTTYLQQIFVKIENMNSGSDLLLTKVNNEQA
jgi:hypothetical protein